MPLYPATCASVSSVFKRPCQGPDWTGLHPPQQQQHLETGVGLLGAWEPGSHPTDESAQGNPGPLGFLGNMYLHPLTPIPFLYLVGYRKELGQWLWK